MNSQRCASGHQAPPCGKGHPDMGAKYRKGSLRLKFCWKCILPPIRIAKNLFHMSLPPNLPPETWESVLRFSHPHSTSRVISHIPSSGSRHLSSGHLPCLPTLSLPLNWPLSRPFATFNHQKTQISPMYPLWASEITNLIHVKFKSFSRKHKSNYFILRAHSWHPEILLHCSIKFHSKTAEMARAVFLTIHPKEIKSREKLYIIQFSHRMMILRKSFTIENTCIFFL